MLMQSKVIVLSRVVLSCLVLFFLVLCGVVFIRVCSVQAVKVLSLARARSRSRSRSPSAHRVLPSLCHRFLGSAPRDGNTSLTAALRVRSDPDEPCGLCGGAGLRTSGCPTGWAGSAPLRQTKPQTLHSTPSSSSTPPNSRQPLTPNWNPTRLSCPFSLSLFFVSLFFSLLVQSMHFVSAVLTWAWRGRLRHGTTTTRQGQSATSG